MSEQKEKKRMRCEECNSRFGYLRKRDNTFICRSCGHETKLKEVKNGKSDRS